MIGNKLLNDKEKFKKIAFDLNLELANNPELPSEEYESSKKIIDILKSNKIDVEEQYCGIETAFLGKIIEGKSDINIGILTEYDALPGIGHACGHSVSAAISVLAALVIKQNEKLIDINVDIIGTPDEEDKGMKIPMAEMGVFDKYDSVIMVHLGTGTSVPNWKLLAFETHEIEFIGKEAHTAVAPWEGRSALDGLMLSIHAIDMMRKMMKPGVVIEGFIQEGGIATNIIPGKTKAKYTFRSEDSNYIKKEINPWLKNILEGCSKATETKYIDKIFDYPFKEMIYNDAGTEIIKNVMKENNISFIEAKKPEGSSDIGNVSYKCPAFHPSIAITDEYIALHTPEIVDLVKSEKSQKAILDGANIILGFLSKIVDDPILIKNIKNEFKEKIK